MAKKIEYPTGNQAIDWLLENERHGLNEDSVTPAIRFLIGKFNELVSESQNSSTSESALPISEVVCNEERVELKCEKCDATKDLLHNPKHGWLCPEHLPF